MQALVVENTAEAGILRAIVIEFCADMRTKQIADIVEGPEWACVDWLRENYPNLNDCLDPTGGIESPDCISAWELAMLFKDARATLHTVGDF
jgi:hypothetical protein